MTADLFQVFTMLSPGENVTLTQGVVYQLAPYISEVFVTYLPTYANSFT